MDEQWRILGVDPQRMRELAARAEAEAKAEAQASLEEDAAAEDDDAEDVELGPEDWRAWRVYLACRRAWRIVSGMGGTWHEGIDPPAVLSALQILRIKPKHWPDVQWRLSVLEDEARQHLNKPPNEDD